MHKKLYTLKFKAFTGARALGETRLDWSVWRLTFSLVNKCKIRKLNQVWYFDHMCKVLRVFLLTFSANAYFL